MHNPKEDATCITVTSAKKGFETFSLTLPQGKLNKQQLQVLLEFKFLCRPYDGLQTINNMLLLYLMGSEMEEMEPKENDALREILNLFTNLWAAENNQHEALDLGLF